MTKLTIGVLLAGLWSGVTPAIGHAAEAPTQDVPVAVQHAIDEMGQACMAWPAFDTENAQASHPVSIDLVALRDRDLCSDVVSPSNNDSSRDKVIDLLIMTVAFFALLGLLVMFQRLWRSARYLVWWIKREKFT